MSRKIIKSVNLCWLEHLTGNCDKLNYLLLTKNFINWNVGKWWLATQKKPDTCSWC